MLVNTESSLVLPSSTKSMVKGVVKQWLSVPMLFHLIIGTFNEYEK